MMKLTHINYWFMLLFLLGFAACSDDENIEKKLSSKLSVSSSSLRFRVNETDTVFVNYAGNWEAKLSDDSWCTLDKASGQGKGEIIITLKPRIDMDMKSSKLIVQATDKPSEFQVINLLLDGVDFYADPIVVEFGLGDNATYAVDVMCDGAWTAKLDDESWCSLDQTSGNGTGKINISSNFSMEDVGEKSTVLTLSSVENPNFTTTVEIKKVEEFKHGSCITLNKATKGKGINLLITGDGFTKSDMVRNGHWQQIMERSLESIFAYEPFKSFREYFNVYGITAVSATNSFHLDGTNSETFFGCSFLNQIIMTSGFTNSPSTFAWEHSPVYNTDVPGQDITVLLSVNINRYCGVAQLSGSGPWMR